MTKAIPLSQGKVALVDDEDFEFLNQWKWHAARDHSKWYARGGNRPTRRPSALHMHRVILEAPLGQQVDHINGDGLDNRRCNLRLCTSSQNHMNSKKRQGYSSRHKGVCWYRRYQKWAACIKANHRKHDLGYFDNEDEAGRVYNAAAKKYHGKFARLNVIEEMIDG